MKYSDIVFNIINKKHSESNCYGFAAPFSACVYFLPTNTCMAIFRGRLGFRITCQNLLKGRGVLNKH